jgi:hypothetical protein
MYDILPWTWSWIRHSFEDCIVFLIVFYMAIAWLPSEETIKVMYLLSRCSHAALSTASSATHYSLATPFRLSPLSLSVRACGDGNGDLLCNRRFFHACCLVCAYARATN